jgi:hypothetical protein
MCTSWKLKYMDIMYCIIVSFKAIVSYLYSHARAAVNYVH